MPYGIKKVKGGFKVHNKKTGKTYAKKPQTKKMAKKQMAALYANANPKNESLERRIDSAIRNHFNGARNAR